MFKKIIVIAVSTTAVFAMHSVEINVNNADLEIAAKVDLGELNEKIAPNTTFLGVKYLNGDKSHSDLDGLEDYKELNFLMQKNITKEFKLGLGVKLSHAEEFTAIPLGVEISYRVPTALKMPFFLTGSAYYAPKVLTAKEADNFLEYRAGVDIEVIENGFVTCGYRVIETNYETVDVEYNKSAYAGFKFAF